MIVYRLVRVPPEAPPAAFGARVSSCGCSRDGERASAWLAAWWRGLVPTVTPALPCVGVGPWAWPGAAGGRPVVIEKDRAREFEYYACLEDVPCVWHLFRWSR